MTSPPSLPDAIDLSKSDIEPGLHEANPIRDAFIQHMKEDLEQSKKDLFACFDTLLTSKHYPNFDCFVPEADDGTKLGFKPALVAAWIAENEKFITDIDTGLLYFYNGKRWVTDAEPYLEKLCSIILGQENKRSYFENIAHDLKPLTYKKVVFSINLVACDNGLLNVETGEFKDFNPDDMPFYSVNAAYDATAECPNFEEFIKQVVNADDIATLQEWSGYCLLPDYRFHKLLWVVGSGRNGKGCWQRTLEGLLGSDNVSNIALEEFDGNHRFGLSQLYGKLFNPCSEPRTNKILQTNLLKYATGQDTLETEVKGVQKRLKFRNAAKITVLANLFPRVNDATTAFRERRLFLKFPNEFLGENQIVNLEKIWLDNPAEKSGVLNWCLKGLQRLLSQGYFTVSKTQAETETEFLRHSDTISAFINEMAIFDKNLKITRAEAFEAYKGYCDFYGLEAENEKRFTGVLKETPKIKDSSVRVSGEKKRAWIGLAAKKLPEDSEVEHLEHLEQHFTLTQNFEESNNSRRDKTGVPTVPSVPTSAESAEVKQPESQPSADSTQGYPDIANKWLLSDTSKPENTRTAGQCGKFHLSSCSFPSGNFETLPSDWYCGNMKCWIAKQPEMSNAGADAELE